MDLENHMVMDSCWTNEVGEEVPFDECAVCGEPLYKTTYYLEDSDGFHYCCVEHALMNNDIREVNWD